MKGRRLLLILFIIIGILKVQSQSDTLSGLSKLRFLINEDLLEDARIELNSQIDFFKAQKNYDTLPYYMEFVGSYKLANNSWELALKRAESFANELKKQNDPSVTKNALKELAWIYDENGKPQIAYKLLEQALQHANVEIKVKGASKATIIYNMGYYAAANGEYGLAKKNYNRTLKALNSSKKKDNVFLQQIYNALGIIMWREGKMDSCSFYFKNSLDALKNANDDPINQFYRPGLVKMNLAVVANILGKNVEAIKFSEDAVQNFQKFISLSIDEQKKNEAMNNMHVAIDNLGVFYNAVGEFKRAEQLINFAYHQKKKYKTSNDPNVIISKIILAQAKVNTRDLREAEKLLDEALAQINEVPEFQLYWKAGALSTKGKIYEENNKIDKAEQAYQQAENLYRRNLNGNYNNEFLIELGNMALFYAKNNNEAKAKSLAHEIYEVSKKGDFKNTLQELNHIIILADTYYRLKDYDKALKYSKEALDFEIGSLNNTASIDSILTQYSKPRAYLINAKSKFFLANRPSEKDLTTIRIDIEKGIDILDQRKNILKNYEDLNQLIHQNNELFSFAKRIRLELYQMTRDKKYLTELVGLHEASIYNRIRSRLNLRREINYSGIPKSIIDQENQLKADLSNSLDPTNNQSLQFYFDASKAMEDFLLMLKKNYPKYYRLKYESVTESFSNLGTIAPKNHVIIRYMFIENDLYVVVLNESKFEVLKLNFTNVEEELVTLKENDFSIANISTRLNNLYNSLWKPLEHLVEQKNVIVIPDRELYNVSFESLLKNNVSSFADIRHESLLAKHAISYNFSLLLINSKKNSAIPSNDYVAFAPEFDSKMKQEYELAITDSLELDKTYLTLLPQPFSSTLAEKYARKFQGEVYTNRNASKQVFLNEANENKIIHIGTHAESNNVSPELSRLIFAKNIDQDSLVNDNSLYTYEIFNYNLNSELAILTACETGKPSYHAGEGMISLSHAFSYAGSKSILTSLWKVDEKSSAEIVGSFYEYLKKGDSKDIALQKAKLDYLSTAQGRTLAPQYWAGLVILGDTSPINFSTPNYGWYIVIGASLLTIFSIIVILWMRKN